MPRRVPWLVDRQVGKPSPRRAPEDEPQRMLRLYHEHYAGFAIRHFHETLRRRHGYTLGYTTTRPISCFSISTSRTAVSMAS